MNDYNTNQQYHQDSNLHRPSGMYGLQGAAAASAMASNQFGNHHPSALYSPHDFSHWTGAMGSANSPHAASMYSSQIRSTYSPSQTASLMANCFPPSMLNHSMGNSGLSMPTTTSLNSSGNSSLSMPGLHNKDSGPQGLASHYPMHFGSAHTYPLFGRHDSRNDISNVMKLAPSSESSMKSKKHHIKKPLNAFMLFMKEMRASVVAECSLKESAAINQILGRKWHALTREAQAKYYDMARKEKELHLQLYPGWSARDNYASHKKRKKKQHFNSMESHHESSKNSHNKFATAYKTAYNIDWKKTSYYDSSLNIPLHSTSLNVGGHNNTVSATNNVCSFDDGLNIQANISPISLTGQEFNRKPLIPHPYYIPQQALGVNHDDTHQHQFFPPGHNMKVDIPLSTSPLRATAGLSGSLPPPNSQQMAQIQDLHQQVTLTQLS